MPAKKKTLWYVGGLYFECAECGECCSGPSEGYIWVTKPEIQIIADVLKISPGQLRQERLRRVGLRTTVIEHPGTKDCIFLQEIEGRKRCMIYPVRPSQCRSWPFWPSNLQSLNAWNQAAQKCSGINQGKYYNFEEIEKIKSEKKWWTDAGQQSVIKKSN
jgi:Fe-S-cluster containining protein